MVKRFSLLVFFRYFVIYQLVIVGLGVIGFLLSGQIEYLLAALMIFLIICLLQWIKLESTFIIVFSNQIIYRHQNSIINYLGKKMGICNLDISNYEDYQFIDVSEIIFKFNYLIVKGRIVKRSYCIYMDDEQVCQSQQFYQEIRIPRVYYQVEQLFKDNFGF